ncbi:MAG: NUDIX domain-containing protein [Bacteroidales bacterium]|nr:NUDIX domain-containing protein [Bacteroidales bacterium]
MNNIDERKDDTAEMLPVVDTEGNLIGCATRGECHGGKMLLHPVVHLHVIDHEGRVYLQKRPVWKEIQPGRWDTAVGGHVAYGEEIGDALRRETLEEVGLRGFSPVLLSRYKFVSSRETEMVYTFATVTDRMPVPSAELDGGRFWTVEEIENAIGTGVLTPNLESEIRIVFDYIRSMESR